MADLNNPLPQPDVGRIHQAQLAIAEEYAKLSNLPAIGHGNAVILAIQEIRREMQEFRREMQEFRREMQEFRREVNERFDGLEAQQHSSNFNDAARVENTYITLPTQRLSPFVNQLTGQPIAEFPTTDEELQGMTGRTINPVLQALLLPVTGDLDERIQRLRHYIGLRTLQV